MKTSLVARVNITDTQQFCLDMGGGPVVIEP
jgi:hypothetical protein